MHTHGLDTWMPKRRLKTPNRTALIYAGEKTTYAELADMADRFSGLLAARGVRHGDRVAFLGENSPEFVAALFGTVQLGAVFVPLNTRLAAPEFRHAIVDSGSKVLISEPEFDDRLHESVDHVVHHIRTGADDLGALLAEAEPLVDRRPVPFDSGAAIVYTSGTTGKPKGAILTHSNLTWASLNVLVDFDMASDDVALMISPMFHVAALGMGLLPVLLKGGAVVLERRFDPGRALSLIQEHGVTMLSGVPTTFQLLCDHPDWATTDVSSLKKLTCGGSAVPTRVLNAYEERGLGFSQGYGMTETSPGATNLVGERTRDKQGSAGLPHFFTEVRVADEHGAVAAPGVVGEIEVYGPNVFPGYHERPDATEAAFTADGWYRSGDLGYMDDEGYLFISDRLKDMIISGGENIYPAEVENHIADIDGVTGVAVIGVPNERWGEVPWAVLTLRDGAEVTHEQVRAHLDGKVARYKMPANTVIIDDFPRTASGKIRKADLRAQYAPLVQS